MTTPAHESTNLDSVHLVPGSLAVKDGPTQPLASLVQVLTQSMSIYATLLGMTVVLARCGAT